jgi:hypothetical protein
MVARGCALDGQVIRRIGAGRKQHGIEGEDRSHQHSGEVETGSQKRLQLLAFSRPKQPQDQACKDHPRNQEPDGMGEISLP